MIELTSEQRQALDQQHGEPVRVIDPSTHDAYVLIRAEVFERMAGLLRPPEHEPPAAIGLPRLRSMQAFWKDLPELLGNQRNHGKWVAYHGDVRIDLGKTQTELYQECFRRGLQRGDFYVGKIKASDIPPWGTVQVDWSLYEYTPAGEGGIPPDAV
jgi:hypothetical protein